METIKNILTIIFGLILGFGLWYLIFWFVSNESNLFIWSPTSKVFYLILGTVSSTNMINEINGNN